MPSEQLTGCENMIKQIITDLEQRKRSLEASKRALEDSPSAIYADVHDYIVGIDVIGRIIDVYKYEEPHMVLVCLGK